MVRTVSEAGLKRQLPQDVFALVSDEEVPNQRFGGLIRVEYRQTPQGRAMVSNDSPRSMGYLDFAKEGTLEVLTHLDQIYPQAPVVIEVGLLGDIEGVAIKITDGHYQLETTANDIPLDIYSPHGAIRYDSGNPDITLISPRTDSRS